MGKLLDHMSVQDTFVISVTNDLGFCQVCRGTDVFIKVQQSGRIQQFETFSLSSVYFPEVL